MTDRWWDISLENKIGSPVNECHHIPISRGRSMLNGVLAVVCGITLGAIVLFLLCWFGIL